jgi:hypothetical protein
MVVDELMGDQKLFEHMLRIIRTKAVINARNRIVELYENGKGNSSYSTSSSIHVLISVIKDELLSLLEELTRARLSLIGLRKLRASIESSLFIAKEDHFKYLTTIRYDQHLNDIQYQLLFDDLLHLVDFKLLLLEKQVWDRRRKFYWDASKLLLSAIIGGIIGAYIKVKMGSN